MRKLLAMLFIMLSISSAFAATELDETEFKIHAYKIDRTSGVEFVVTDALSSFDMMKRIKQGDTLVLDDYIPNYLGDPDKPPSAFAEMIIFSYRAAGTGGLGTYTVKLTFKPFSNISEEASTKTITAGYTLGNVNYIFEKSSTNTLMSGQNTIAEIKSGSSRLDHAVVPGESGSASGILSDSWNISGNGAANEPWIVRGAVALVLDSSEYQSADYGTYKAEVSVEFIVP